LFNATAAGLRVSGGSGSTLPTDSCTIWYASWLVSRGRLFLILAREGILQYCTANGETSRVHALTRRSIAIAVAVLVAIIATWFALDTRMRHRVHAENMAKAEQIKLKIDEQFPEGSALSAVEDYLRTVPMEIERSTGYNDRTREQYVQALRIAVANERSIKWYCGTVKVGVIAQFTTSQTLAKTEVSWWSSDCL
jgi:hypothetical protein